MASPRDLRLLTYFTEIARAGSIRGAASHLSLSPAVMSEALSDLEDIVGLTLIQRTTRSMRLTEAGDAMLRHAALAISAADEAMAVNSRDAARPSGIVRLTLAAELSVGWLPPVLRAFESAHPEIRIEVNADDSVISLGSSGFDIAIRTGFDRQAKSGKDVCAVTPVELVCAPQLLGSDGEALSSRLKRLSLIGRASRSDRGAVIEAFPKTGGKQKRTLTIEVPSRFNVNSQLVAHRLALEGFGAALLMHDSVVDDLASGKLVRVSDSYSFGVVTCHAIARDRYPSRAAAAFLKFILSPQSQSRRTAAGR